MIRTVPLSVNYIFNFILFGNAAMPKAKRAAARS